MKKFMLLGQGDFVAALLDAVGPELGKRAENVYRHNIVGVLDTALRGTNAQYLPQYVLDRCGIKLYEPSPGDTGWDVFSLDYHVESPLSAVVHASASSKYRKVFHLLWRLKRIEWGLNNTWRRATSVNHSLRAQNGREGSIIRALRKVRFELTIHDLQVVSGLILCCSSLRSVLDSSGRPRPPGDAARNVQYTELHNV